MWKILEDQYEPRTRVTLRQVQRQLNAMKMTDDSDISRNRNKEQSEEISDAGYIGVLPDSAPTRYDIQIVILEVKDDPCESPKFGLSNFH